MKNYNRAEIILFSKYSRADSRHKEQVTWLGTTAQSAIVCQHEKAKKFFLRTLKDTPAIYLS